MSSESYSNESENICLLYYIIGYHVYSNLERKLDFGENDCLFMGWYVYHNFIISSDHESSIHIL